MVSYCQTGPGRDLGLSLYPIGLFIAGFISSPEAAATDPRCVVQAIIISIRDGIVHFVGDPADVDEVVDRLLDDY